MIMVRFFCVLFVGVPVWLLTSDLASALTPGRLKGKTVNRHLRNQAAQHWRVPPQGFDLFVLSAGRDGAGIALSVNETLPFVHSSVACPITTRP